MSLTVALMLLLKKPSSLIKIIEPLDSSGCLVCCNLTVKILLLQSIFSTVPLAVVGLFFFASMNLSISEIILEYFSVFMEISSILLPPL